MFLNQSQYEYKTKCLGFYPHYMKMKRAKNTLVNSIYTRVNDSFLVVHQQSGISMGAYIALATTMVGIQACSLVVAVSAIFHSLTNEKPERAIFTILLFAPMPVAGLVLFCCARNAVLNPNSL